MSNALMNETIALDCADTMDDAAEQVDGVLRNFERALADSPEWEVVRTIVSLLRSAHANIDQARRCWQPLAEAAKAEDECFGRDEPAAFGGLQ